MAIRRNLVYTSFHREANFYEVIYNGRVAAFEVSGKDLLYSGRVERSVFNRLLKETKAKDGATYEKQEKIRIEKNFSKKVEPKTRGDGLSAIIKIKVDKKKYAMTQSEWAWNYLPTI